MSNCHKFFLEYCNSISLTHEELARLKKSSQIVSAKIFRHFKRRKLPLPTFRIQGSVAIDTVVRLHHGKYDLDLGVYFENLSSSGSLPKVEDIQDEIIAAIYTHTSMGAVRKVPCVRLKYRPVSARTAVPSSYHLDLPIYTFGLSMMGKKPIIGKSGKKQWSEFSDVIEFESWFNGCGTVKNGNLNQLKRIVKYFKAWKNSHPDFRHFLNGMAITILCGQSYQAHRNDDVAFHRTMNSIFKTLKEKFNVVKPVEPFDIVTHKLKPNYNAIFLGLLEKLVDMGTVALNSRKTLNSLSIWNEIFNYKFVSSLASFKGSTTAEDVEGSVQFTRLLITSFFNRSEKHSIVSQHFDQPHKTNFTVRGPMGQYTVIGKYLHFGQDHELKINNSDLIGEPSNEIWIGLVVFFEENEPASYLFRSTAWNIPHVIDNYGFYRGENSEYCIEFDRDTLELLDRSASIERILLL